MAFVLLYTHGMVKDAAWVSSQLEVIKRKRDLLQLLEGKLAAWENQANWQGISPAKRRALTALASESKATIEAMMSRVSGDIRKCIEGIKRGHG